MARTKAHERAGTRILSDGEIRILWPVVEHRGTFGSVVKVLLLTGQRRFEVAHMAWTELDGNGAWTIPAERYKTKRAHFVPLSRAALDIVESQPRTSALVFPSAANTKFSGFARHKAALDRKVAERNNDEPLAPWRLHDLRRTARSLMARAGVPDGVAERVLGHVVPGVRGVYDRHSYADEKRDALEKLAAMIEHILKPLPSNVMAPIDRRVDWIA
jgi:integrase